MENKKLKNINKVDKIQLPKIPIKRPNIFVDKKLMKGKIKIERYIKKKLN